MVFETVYKNNKKIDFIILLLKNRDVNLKIIDFILMNIDKINKKKIALILFDKIEIKNNELIFKKNVNINKIILEVFDLIEY